MPEHPQSCLNIGSGTALGFEQFLHTKRNGIDSVDCVDFFSLENEIKMGGVINKFIQRDLEVPFQLPDVYDIVFCFEVIEHVDKTDVLLENCYNHLKKDGLFILAVPNLSSLFTRIESLLGFQPHILEVSNKKANFGMGMFGKLNNPDDEPIHHIRGITYKAMKEMLEFYNFKIVRSIKSNKGLLILKVLPPSLSSVVVFICKK
jgi:SAM-dependent methyltransferase